MPPDEPNALRILLLLENAGAGSGRHVIDLARGLSVRGHDVTLLYSQSRLEDWFERELRASPAVRRATLPMRPGLGPADASTIVAVRRFIQNNGPFDVIHGHSSKAGALARLGGWKTPGVKVYTPHAFYTLGSPAGSATGWFYASLERVLARLCDGIICVSTAEGRHAESRLAISPMKLFVVPNGLDPLPPGDRMYMRARLGLEDANFCIGFVGRLARQKAVHRLLEAFAAVYAANAHARLVIVGDGSDADSLKRLGEQLGLAEAVTWTGAADGIEMMSAFDLFAMPSLYEAFPYVLLEAMHRGLPILATRVGGVDELVREDVNGHVVEQGDVHAYAQRLAERVADPAGSRRMGAASRQIVAGFDLDAMVNGTAAVYRALLARAG
jgi:glycosyltransferase involved in cell wall biosynthesis